MAEKTKHVDKDSWKIFAFLGPDPITFFEEQPLYKDLCREVEYILRERFQKDGISVGAITSRAKSYKSVADKMRRSVDQDKPDSIHDRAGARVVYLYRSDLPKIEESIRDEFTVIDNKDSATDQEPGQFGYRDVKFWVMLKKQAGPRYDKLKRLICEIQVRTVCQDAWALVSQDLVYKRESQIPKAHKRALTRFVGLFELADEQFDAIRTELQKEREKITAKATPEFLEQAINLDTLKVFIEKYIVPERPILPWEIASFPILVDRLRNAGYKTLKELHAAIEKSVHIIEGLKLDIANKKVKEYFSGVQLEAAVANSDKKYLEHARNKSGLEALIIRAKDSLKAS